MSIALLFQHGGADRVAEQVDAAVAEGGTDHQRRLLVDARADHVPAAIVVCRAGS